MEDATEQKKPNTSIPAEYKKTNPARYLIRRGDIMCTNLSVRFSSDDIRTTMKALRRSHPVSPEVKTANKLKRSDNATNPKIVRTVSCLRILISPYLRFRNYSKSEH